MHKRKTTDSRTVVAHLGKKIILVIWCYRRQTHAKCVLRACVSYRCNRTEHNTQVVYVQYKQRGNSPRKALIFDRLIFNITRHPCLSVLYSEECGIQNDLLCCHKGELGRIVHHKYANCPQPTSVCSPRLPSPKANVASPAQLVELLPIAAYRLYTSLSLTVITRVKHRPSAAFRVAFQCPKVAVPAVYPLDPSTAHPFALRPCSHLGLVRP